MSEKNAVNGKNFQFSKEEKIAIETLKNIAIYMGDNFTFSQQGIRNLRENLRIVLPTIEKQQNKIATLEKQIKLMQNCDLVEKIEGQEALIDNLKHNETVYQEIIEKQQKEIDRLKR